jgi:hypothetical protein
MNSLKITIINNNNNNIVIVPQSLFKNLKILDLENTLVVEIQNSYFYIKCAKRVFFVHEKVFYAETKVEAV